MKIKVLAAMMALASTGAMANVADDSTFETVWATSSSQTLTATGTINKMCLVTKVDTSAMKLSFGSANEANAVNFSVATNGGIPTFAIADVSNNMLTVLGDAAATIVYTDGSNALNPTNNAITDGSFKVALHTQEQEHELKANSNAEAKATITVNCG